MRSKSRSKSMVEDAGSSVTLIFYSIDANWWRGTEPLLNLLAAAAQFSPFSHVELAIGEGAGAMGEMSNVLRIFNDSTGVELAQRTGKNPSFEYLQIGCSKRSELAMLQFARRQIGKPFSSTAMARSLLWPRQSDGLSWYCAELVAACLQHGGLMSTDSAAGAATPASIYKLYKTRSAMSANPCTLRQQFQQFQFAGKPSRMVLAPLFANSLSIRASESKRPNSPPRASFKVVQARERASRSPEFSLSLNSLGGAAPRPNFA